MSEEKNILIILYHYPNKTIAKTLVEKEIQSLHQFYCYTKSPKYAASSFGQRLNGGRPAYSKTVESSFFEIFFGVYPVKNVSNGTSW